MAASKKQPTRDDGRRTATPGWHIVLYVVAVLNVVTVGAALWIGHRTAALHRSSVEFNRAWTDPIILLEEIERAAARVVAPASDVFESDDVARERGRRDLAHGLFANRLDDFRESVDRLVVTPEDGSLVRPRIARLNATMEALIDRSELVFTFMLRGQRAAASHQLSALNRQLIRLREEGDAIARQLRDIQERTFDEQFATAARYRGYLEIAGSAVIVIALMTLFYGYAVRRIVRRLETEREEHVARLETARREAETLARKAELGEKAKSAFLAMMSHEIRTPMNGIIGMAGLILDGSLADDQRRAAVTIRDSADALMRILNDILDFSKLEAGRLDLEHIPFALRAPVEHAIAILEPRAADKGLSLSLSVAPDVPDTVLGDPGRLRQIILNLVGNAIKFTDRGGVTVAVHPTTVGSGATGIRFEVVDTGIGVSPQALPHLFEEFSQGDSSTSRRHGGTGLGLAISRRIVEQMGGEIGVASEPGAGSRFWFTAALAATDAPLPAAITDAVDGEERALYAWVRDSGRTIRVLVAEDNETNQLVATQVLLRLGLAADVAANGREAVEAVGTGHYDLVLMDLQMPEMDGLAATRQIRTLGSAIASIPIVACTANAHAEDVERCRAAGMDDYIAKPFNRSRLAAVLLRVLARTATEPVATPGPVERVGGPVLDEAVLRSLAQAIGPAATRRICSLFLSEGAKSIAALRALHEARDTTALARAAHSLKSAAANVGAARLSVLARTIEAAPDAAAAVEDGIRGIEADFAELGASLGHDGLWDRVCATAATTAGREPRTPGARAAGA